MTEEPTETSRRVITTGVNDEDRAREEQIDVTGWTDGSVGIGVEYAAEDTRTSTYAEGDVAREVGYAILAATHPSRDVRIEHLNDDRETWGTMVQSASIDNRGFLTASPSDDIRTIELPRDAVGTLYLDPATGTAYRLRGWDHRIGSAGVDEPSYSSFLPDGMSSSWRGELPEGTIPVWSPAPIPGTVR